MAGMKGMGKGDSSQAPRTPPQAQVGIIIDKQDASPLARRSSRHGMPDDKRVNEGRAGRQGAYHEDRFGDRQPSAVQGKVIKQNRYNPEGEPATDPLSIGLGAYAELNESVPEVSDDRRYAVRDVTARQVLLQLGARADGLGGYYSFENDAYNVLQEVTKRGKSDLPVGLQKQLEMTRLFVYADANPTPSSASNASEPVQYGANTTSPKNALEDPKYLLGKYECLAIPARADFDWAFDPIRNPASSSSPTNGNAASSAARDNGERQPQSTGRSSSTASRNGGKGGFSVTEPPLDCDTASGFAGWFYVLHQGAPNIGESAQAEDFLAFSRDVLPEESNPVVNPGGAVGSNADAAWKAVPSRAGKFLDEDLYCSTMYHLWRLSILAMAKLGVTDCILFPFGMGAFLRHLGKCDERYLDGPLMRRLRRRVADELMKAIVSVYGDVVKTRISNLVRKDLPQRIHLCLMFNGPESAENHNVFVEAAGDIAKLNPGVADIMKIRRNADCLQLAHKLAADSAALKVGILNGANRKLVGNHWFQKGARNAIDENLHRRSSSMTRAALLLNMGTEPVERRPDELSSTLTWLGGKAEPLSGQEFAAAKAKSMAGQDRAKKAFEEERARRAAALERARQRKAGGLPGAEMPRSLGTNSSSASGGPPFKQQEPAAAPAAERNNEVSGSGQAMTRSRQAFEAERQRRAEALERAKARKSGLDAGPELNLDSNAGSGKSMSAGQAAPRRGFFEGLRVRLKGLEAKPELNGTTGTLMQKDESKGRWQVNMEDGSGKMLLKEQNMEPALLGFGGAGGSSRPQASGAPGATGYPGSRSAVGPGQSYFGNRGTGSYRGGTPSYGGYGGQPAYGGGEDLDSLDLECKAGHHMEQVNDSTDMYECDVCERDMPPPEDLFYCDGCDFAVCSDCAGEYSKEQSKNSKSWHK